MKLKKTLLSTIFGLSLLAPLFDAYAMEPDEDALQQSEFHSRRQQIIQSVYSINGLDISDCTYIEFCRSTKMFMRTIQAEQIQAEKTPPEFADCQFYPYIGPADIEITLDSAYVVVNNDILCDKLGLKDKPQNTNKYLRQLLKRGDLKSESTLDSSRCVGFKFFPNQQDQDGVSVYPMRIVSSLSDQKPHRAQSVAIPTSQGALEKLEFHGLPKIRTVLFSETEQKSWDFSFACNHFYSNIESNFINPEIIIFRGITQESINEAFKNYRERKAQMSIKSIFPPSNTTPVAAAAPADEMTQAEKVDETAQAAATERQAAIAQAEKTADAAQDHYNMDDLDNSLPDNATDATD